MPGRRLSAVICCAFLIVVGAAPFLAAAEHEPSESETAAVLAAGDPWTEEVAGVAFTLRFVPAANVPSSVITIGRASWQTLHQAEGTEFWTPAFWIGETEVTYELWYAVSAWAADHGYVFANRGREGSHGEVGQPPSFTHKTAPATGMSWRDALVWCNALSELAGLEPVYMQDGVPLRNSTDGSAFIDVVQENVFGYRLPNSSEWELAARYEDGTSWTPENYTSGAAASSDSPAAVDATSWYRENSGGRAQLVALKQANALGLYDMSGNVAEKCFDRVGTFPFVLGGSWNSPAQLLQVSHGALGSVVLTGRESGLRLVVNAVP